VLYQQAINSKQQLVKFKENFYDIKEEDERGGRG